MNGKNVVNLSFFLAAPEPYTMVYELGGTPQIVMINDTFPWYPSN